MAGKIQYYVASTLDGFIATPDDSLDWLFSLGSVEQSSYPEFIADVGALAMGAATYRWLIRNADAVMAEVGNAWPYTQPTWVFSHQNLPPPPSWADVRIVRGKVADLVGEILAAAGSKNLWVVGGGDLAGQFLDAGYLDELIVQIGSATLGSGKPLLPRRVLSPVLRLTSVRQMGEALVELRYAVKKEPVSRG